MGDREPEEQSIGAAMVEFAILAPLLILLVFGIFTVARALNVQNTLEHAAREAARFGAVDNNLVAVEDAARGEVEAAAISWASIARCFAEMEDATVDASRVAGSIGGNPVVAPCITVANGAGSNDPTAGERIQVLVAFPDYQLDFIFFDLTVDLIGTAVSREEPGT